MFMEWLATATGYLAPVFIAFSPIISYGDQALSMHRRKSSVGFSLDIPLLMLIASLFRIFYWPGARFDTSLLIQSILMVGMHGLLLKIALDHRPAPATKGGDAATPFASSQDESFLHGPRPYNFWQWRSPKPYWQFLFYVFAGLFVCELVLRMVPPVYPTYSTIIGTIGLTFEAILPVPQIIANTHTKSCKGFRISLLFSWLAGDTMKMFWFFTATTEIPWTFKICGIFQAMCDSFLGAQYFYYGEGEPVTSAVKEHYPLEEGQWATTFTPGVRPASRSLTPTRRPAPFSDLEME